MGFVSSFEVWIPDANNIRDHFMLVDFDYRLVDEGIGWNEWCGIPSFHSMIVPEICINNVCLVFGDRIRSLKITNNLRNRLEQYVVDNFNFEEEDE